MIEIPERLIQDVFGATCRGFALRIARLSPRDVVLISPTYAIYFSTEPNEDAINTWYFDIPNRADRMMMNYNLGLFLSIKRPIPPGPKTSFATQEQEMRAAFKRILAHFLERAQDVLRGEKDWLKDYPPTWSVHPVEGKVAQAIRSILGGR